ncbi:hypothetical protein [Brevibacillus migulae]|uniref:hypothetical protein n=1 Tax=Brevibacillus migulae TaxID=1644114 RepID=UPI00106ED2C9|nr:hypothetical protein [Brevibacillus migulae]
MNIQLLQWGLLSFMIGLILSLPLAAVHYQKNSTIKNFFTNQRKLKSAHLDFFTQAFAAGFVYLLEYSVKTPFPNYIVYPLFFGTIMNPLLLLLESTLLIRSGFFGMIYHLVRATSPLSLLFAWTAIAVTFLPRFMILSLLAFILMGSILLISHLRKSTKAGESVHEKL